jgi:hypothetical protein
MPISNTIPCRRLLAWVRASPDPNAWRIRNLTVAAIPLGLFKLCYYVNVLAVGWWAWIPSGCKPLTFLMGLVFAGQATVYVLREHGHLWNSRPASIILLASSVDAACVACDSRPPDDPAFNRDAWPSALH